ncbi:hypothetical protein BV22DRAFT_842993 [Leucogyrophana mollusca]|uniref:Uncharacterized protein n=1 Tax=Leucogyrophana mollusca TaxID=85980 RepID=A0ACB8B2R0_9AGAM|nr:hypothetical protein BV22DRAFT_842993 [Leucogyrophana mollusca]
MGASSASTAHPPPSAFNCHILVLLIPSFRPNRRNLCLKAPHAPSSKAASNFNKDSSVTEATLHMPPLCSPASAAVSQLTDPRTVRLPLDLQVSAPALTGVISPLHAGPWCE